MIEALQLLTVKQTAQRLAVSTRLVRRLLQSGELPCVRVAGAVRVAESDLHDYVANNRTAPVAAAAVLPQPTPPRRRSSRPATRYVYFPPAAA